MLSIFVFSAFTNWFLTSSKVFNLSIFLLSLTLKNKIPSGKNIRVDDAFSEGMDIPIYYYPMIAKLIVWDETREKAIEKMVKAIDKYQISGIKTTLDFGKYVLKHPAFISGNFYTNFINSCFHHIVL